MERIECAAIQHQGKTYALARPARHNDIINWICDEREISFVGSSGQGFLTNTGRFVNRKDAQYIARDAKQIVQLIGSVLTSEDMW